MKTQTLSKCIYTITTASCSVRKNNNNNNNNNYHLLDDRYIPGTVIRIYMDLTHLNSVWQVLLLFWYKRWGTRAEPGCLIPEQSIFTSIHAIAEGGLRKIQDSWPMGRASGLWEGQCGPVDEHRSSSQVNLCSSCDSPLICYMI